MNHEPKWWNFYCSDDLHSPISQTFRQYAFGEFLKFSSARLCVCVRDNILRTFCTSFFGGRSTFWIICNRHSSTFFPDSPRYLLSLRLIVTHLSLCRGDLRTSEECLFMLTWLTSPSSDESVSFIKVEQHAPCENWFFIIPAVSSAQLAPSRCEWKCGAAFHMWAAHYVLGSFSFILIDFRHTAVSADWKAICITLLFRLN